MELTVIHTRESLIDYLENCPVPNIGKWNACANHNKLLKKELEVCHFYNTTEKPNHLKYPQRAVGDYYSDLGDWKDAEKEVIFDMEVLSATDKRIVLEQDSDLIIILYKESGVEYFLCTKKSGCFMLKTFGDLSRETKGQFRTKNLEI